jgi:membrane-bound lytic murein transglycosylase D
MQKAIKTFKPQWLLIAVLIVTVSFVQIFSGCTPAVEEKNPEEQRMKDSISTYQNLDKALKFYKEALKYNAENEPDDAKKSFEKSLKNLKYINEKVLSDVRNIKWKNDYLELGTAIVQDFLTTSINLEEDNIVFEFAKKFNIDYQKNDLFTEEDNDPLPEGSEVKLIRNTAVDEYIDFFSKTERGRGFIDKTIYRSGKYFPLMRKILKHHNAPEELVYLSIAESGLNPTIISRAGAVGLWQFMPSTGSSYGLYSDGFRDDRRDFEKSTDAAARHLKDLYKTFNDWYLAFASYNAGPGRITSAMNKCGCKDFWEARTYLPNETKNYVPQILALSFIYRNPKEFGFNDIDYGTPITFDRVNIKANLSFEKIAEFCETDIETIRELNPELTQDIIPVYDVPYHLRIPRGTFQKFEKNYKKSYEYEKNGSIPPEFAGDESIKYKEEFLGTEYLVKGYDPGDPKLIGNTKDKKMLTWVFKTSDKLETIADSFSVRVYDIKLWNNIPFSGNPAVNQILSIYLTDESFDRIFKIETNKEDTTGVKEEVKIKEDTAGVIIKKEEKIKEEKNNNKETTKKEKKKPTGKEQTYTVKEGDMLSKIAEDFGVKISDIKEWNNLKDDKILVGQKLKIYSNKKTVKKNFETHTVEEGENLSEIAEMYGVTVNELKEWNELESDVIKIGQVLKVSAPKEKKKETTVKKGTKHKVKEGENLTSIADEYDVTIEDLMVWNDLESDVIKTGQVLIVTDPEKETKKKETKQKETKNLTEKKYKVKKGDTLESIADDFGVTIADIKKWNNIKNDKILIGQVLKIFIKEEKKKKK